MLMEICEGTDKESIYPPMVGPRLPGLVAVQGC